MPGKWFTDFPKDKSVYYRWLSQIGDMNANTVRIYTLLDPEFYSAFALYNRLHPDKPLYLMQEIWPEEEPHNGDYLSDGYRTEFEKEIRHVVDAVHGNASIAERRGRCLWRIHYQCCSFCYWVSSGKRARGLKKLKQLTNLILGSLLKVSI